LILNDSLALKLQKLSIFVFNELALKNWAVNMHFNPIPIHKPFSKGGGGAGRIDSDPLAFVGLKQKQTTNFEELTIFVRAFFKLYKKQKLLTQFF